MIPKSNEIRFETTTKCNYCCLPCPREKLTRKKETTSLEKFKYIFDKVRKEAAQYDTITLSGFGEPFLDPTVFEKIKYSRDKGFDVLILSNAALLTVDRFKKLEELGVKSLRISFYGMSPESYVKVHGIKNKGLFSKTKENLEKIAKMKKKTELIFTYNIIPGVNDHETKEWIKFWENKVDLVEVWKPHNWVYGREYRPIQKEKVKSCGRPWTTPLQIQADGTVVMCCFDFDGRLLLGDLNTQSLEEIFSSEPYLTVEKCHKTGNFEGKNLICEYCDQRNKDKSDVMVYNSKFDIKDRVGKASTIYTDFVEKKEKNQVA